VQRSPALQPLSRDHHHALVVAQRLVRAEADAAQAFLAFWRDEGRHHFVVEEEVLLPALDAVDGDEAPEVLRVLRDHAAIRRAAARLDAGGAADPAALRALGERLREHVRFEERVLFALLEARLDEAALAALGERVLAADQRR
jgi:iron-sulfur cluster repair protein YtfE (RIC family)